MSGCGVIIAAAGQGKRMGLGQNKLFYELENKPIIIHTLEKFIDKKWVNEIIVVAKKEEIEFIKGLLDTFHVRVDAIVAGGKERQESIEFGLHHVHSEWVMVHDGARPFIRSSKLVELYETVQMEDAVVLGVPVKDTIKIVDEQLEIKATPERKGLWAVQTPQAFRLSLLKNAYKNANESNYLGTDDSSLVEKLGVKVKILEGSYENIKITTKEDLIIAKSILKSGVE